MHLGSKIYAFMIGDDLFWTRYQATVSFCLAILTWLGASE